MVMSATIELLIISSAIVVFLALGDGWAAKVLSPPGCVEVSTLKNPRLKSCVEYRCPQSTMLRNTHQLLRIEKSLIHIAPPSSNSADEYFDSTGFATDLPAKTLIRWDLSFLSFTHW